MLLIFGEQIQNENKHEVILMKNLEKKFYREKKPDLANQLANAYFERILQLRSKKINLEEAFTILDSFQVLIDTVREQKQEEDPIAFLYARSISNTIYAWCYFNREKKIFNKILELMDILEEMWVRYDRSEPPWDRNDTGTIGEDYGHSIAYLLSRYGQIEDKKLRKKYMNRLIELYEKYRLLDESDFEEFLTRNISQEIRIHKEDLEYVENLLEKLNLVIEKDKLEFNIERVSERLGGISEGLSEEQLYGKSGQLLLKTLRYICDKYDSVSTCIELGWHLERMIRSLKNKGKEEEVPPLLDELRLLNERYDAEEIKGLYLKATGHDEHQLLIKMLRGEITVTWDDIVNELNRLDEEQLIEPLIRLLDEKENKKQIRDVSFILGEIGNKRAVQPLLLTLKDDLTDEYKENEIIDALIKLDIEKILPCLLEILNSGIHKERKNAINSLVDYMFAVDWNNYYYDEIISSLTKKMKKGNKLEKIGIIETFEELNNRESISENDTKIVDSLIQSLKDEDADVRELAETLLEKMKKKPC